MSNRPPLDIEVYSAYLDSNTELHLYGKDGEELNGWPDSWPREILDVAHFLKCKDITLRN